MFLAPFKVNGFAVCSNSISNTRTLIKCIQNLSAWYIYACSQVYVCLFSLPSFTPSPLSLSLLIEAATAVFAHLCAILASTGARPKYHQMLHSMYGNDRIDTHTHTNWFIVHKLRSQMRKAHQLQLITNCCCSLSFMCISSISRSIYPITHAIALSHFSVIFRYIQSKWNDCKPLHAFCWFFVSFVVGYDNNDNNNKIQTHCTDRCRKERENQYEQQNKTNWNTTFGSNSKLNWNSTYK